MGLHAIRARGPARLPGATYDRPMVRRTALLAALLLLGAPAAAGAKLPEEETGSAPPGITVTESGLASVERPARLSDESIGAAVEAALPAATSRAVNQARRRAASIAEAAGWSLGPALEVAEAGDELGLPHADDAGYCRVRRRRGQRPRTVCFVPQLVPVTVRVRFAAGGGAESERSVTGTGSAVREIGARTSPNNRAIRVAIFEARQLALPDALASAREHAARLGRSAQLDLRELAGLEEDRSGGHVFSELFGPFGIGRHCGVVRRPVFRRDADGRRRRVGVRRERRCILPPPIAVILSATYAATPAASASGR